MDKRTKRQKLQDMANQSVSPKEAEIARTKLDELPEEELIFTAKTGTIYTDGVKVGETREVRFTVNLEPDPGIGVFDFVNQTWNWTPKPSGTE